MGEISRRDLLKTAAGGSLAIAGGSVLAACGSSSSSATGGATSGGGTPQRGGTLRIGLTGGASSDTFDPHLALTTSDFTRAEMLFEGLVGVDTSGRIRNRLAEELSVDKTGTVWTARLHKGVDFHNGKELTADDVIFTFQRILDPKAPLIGASSIELMDVKNLKKRDKYTLEVPFVKPFAILDQVLAGGQFNGSTYYMIVPQGFDVKSPVGTAAFKYKSFTPNQQTAVVRNDNYWQKGLPYLDGVIATEYADEASQVNALVAGQEDAINSVSIGSVAPIEGAGKSTLISDSGQWIPFVMRTDVDPLSAVEVRQALRLAVDRQQILDQVYGGHGTLGNDIFGIFTPEYDKSIPQREQDTEQAKSLLKTAGQEGLNVQLVTAPIAQGAVPVAEVFAQQAAESGIKVNLKKTTPTEIFGSNFLQLPFTQDFWLGLNYLPLVGLATSSKAPLNETHFDNAKYDELFNQAIGTIDSAKRKTLIQDMQLIDHEEGGYIIPFFAPVIDGVADNVHGISATRSGLSLHDYNFTETWLA